VYRIRPTSNVCDTSDESGDDMSTHEATLHTHTPPTLHTHKPHTHTPPTLHTHTHHTHTHSPHSTHTHTRTLTVGQISEESLSDRLELSCPENVYNEFAKSVALVVLCHSRDGDGDGDQISAIAVMVMVIR
jgi:hypothetical protein